MTSLLPTLGFWHADYECPLLNFFESRLTNPPGIASLRPDQIVLDLFSLSEMPRRCPLPHSLQRAETFIKTFRTLCDINSKDDQYWLNLVFEESLAEIFACSLEHGPS